MASGDIYPPWPHVISGGIESPMASCHMYLPQGRGRGYPKYLFPGPFLGREDGGTPVISLGQHTPRRGYTAGGGYVSCGHAGGLSCSKFNISSHILEL